MASKRRFWFRDARGHRELVAAAYEEIPIERLGLRRLEALALSRHFGKFESVADLLRADTEIRHVRNLGVRGLAHVDDALRPLLVAGPVTPERADALLRDALPGIESLDPGDAQRLPWFLVDQAERAEAAQPYARMPLAAWGLSNRARNAVTFAGLRTVAEVLATDVDLRGKRGFGTVTLAEIHLRGVLTLQHRDEVAKRWSSAEPDGSA